MTAPADGTIIRPALPGDLNFIFANVLRDMRDADGSALEDDLWFPAHRAYLERVLMDRTVEVHVLAAEDDHNEILGFCIARPGQELIWCHIRKGPLRERGLAKRLLSSARVLEAPASWMTPMGRKRLRNPWRGRRLRRRPSSASP
jgi:hypothetical protein